MSEDHMDRPWQFPTATPAPATPPRAMAELLEWHDATASKPDAEVRVLIWMDTGEARDWESAWWDGEQWRLCESGGVCAARVLYYAQPEGPEC